jgi:hypothetical protein
MAKETERKNAPAVKGGTFRVVPLKDFRITQNDFDLKLFKGLEVDVPEVYRANLITEGVIKKEGDI